MTIPLLSSGGLVPWSSDRPHSLRQPSLPRGLRCKGRQRNRGGRQEAASQLRLQVSLSRSFLCASFLVLRGRAAQLQGPERTTYFRASLGEDRLPPGAYLVA